MTTTISNHWNLTLTFHPRLMRHHWMKAHTRFIFRFQYEPYVYLAPYLSYCPFRFVTFCLTWTSHTRKNVISPFWKPVYGFLVATNTNHVSILHHFQVIVHLRIVTLGLTLNFHVTSPFDGPYMVSYSLLIQNLRFKVNIYITSKEALSVSLIQHTKIRPILCHFQ